MDQFSEDFQAHRNKKSDHQDKSKKEMALFMEKAINKDILVYDSGSFSKGSLMGYFAKVSIGKSVIDNRRIHFGQF